jgi:hypothetical protein
VADARPAGLELGESVAVRHAVELGVAERAGGRRGDEQLAADVWSLDHRGQRNRRVGVG